MTQPYQFIKLIAEDRAEAEGTFQRVELVKLGATRIARMLGKRQYVDVDYVLVSSSSLIREDKNGLVNYQETAIIGCDPEGKPSEAVLYLAPRALETWEAMFAIGEVPTFEGEKNVTTS